MRGASLAGRTALVIGAAGGIGTAVTEELLRCGATVLGVDLAAPDTTQAPWHDPNCRMLTGDATSPDTATRAFAALPGPSPTLLVMSTIYERLTPLAGATAEGFQNAYQVMTVSAWRWAAALGERLEGRPGSIVGISSVHAHAAAADYGPYSAAKSALLALTRTMAVEWGPLNVRCNTVSPAFVAVPRNRDAWQDAESTARREARFPLGRCPSPDDIATAVRFLLSDEASAITGIDLPVDAGLLSRLP